MNIFIKFKICNNILPGPTRPMRKNGIGKHAKLSKFLLKSTQIIFIQTYLLLARSPLIVKKMVLLYIFIFGVPILERLILLTLYLIKVKINKQFYARI